MMINQMRGPHGQNSPYDCRVQHRDTTAVRTAVSCAYVYVYVVGPHLKNRKEQFQMITNPNDQNFQYRVKAVNVFWMCFYCTEQLCHFAEGHVFHSVDNIPMQTDIDSVFTAP